VILKRALQGAGVMSVAAVASVAMATSALAADYEMNTRDGGDTGGKIEFTRSGDKLEVCDEQADGWRAVAYVINPDGSERYKLPVSGDGDCKTKSAENGSPFNLNEKKTYTFKVCLDHDNPNHSDDRFCNEASWKAG
jgi:hypothetical protein